MAPTSDIARGSTTRHHSPTCNCVSNDISPVVTWESSSSSSREEIQCLDKEIEHTNDALITLELKRRRNARLPVARIPPELLSEIFVYFRDASTPPVASYWYAIPWISIIHVFVLWRSVALSNPRLWNIVNLRFPDLVCHSSRHFATMPLHIMLSSGWYKAGTDRSLDAILASHNPIISLEMRALFQESVFILQNLLPRAADHILHLDIGLPNLRIKRLQNLQTTPTPKLQILSLENVQFDLSCSLLASCTGSLRELKLSRCGISEYNYKVLESFVRLEKLCLSHTEYNAFEPINLPRMTELYVEDDRLESILSSLHAFRCSRGCTITVCPVASYDNFADQLGSLVAYISSAHPDHTRARIADEFVELYCEGENTHYTLHYPYDPEMPSPGVLPALLPYNTTELSLTCDDSVGLSRFELEVIGEAVKDVHSLYVCGRPLVVSLETCIRENIDFLPSLSLIRVCNCSAEWGGQLLHAALLREELDARIGGVDICGGFR